MVVERGFVHWFGRIAIAMSLGCYAGLPEADDVEVGGEGLDDPDVGDHHTAIGVRRLSKFEYGNTIRDLLGVEGAEAGLPDDQKVEFLSNNAHAKRLGLAELEALSRTAEDASAAGVTLLTLPEGCALATLDRTCVSTFLDAFLLRSFRRPPTDAEVERYAGLFDDRLAAGDGSQEALRVVVEAILLSPHFLYRSEVGSSGPDAEGLLTSYEIASRLSYLLWGSMPDDELFAVAADDALVDPEIVAAQTRRMLDDPRAETGVVRFVAEWLGFDAVEIAKKSDAVTAGLPDTLQADLEEETRRFVADALLGPRPSLDTLLTSTTTFANATLGSIYGLDIEGAEFRAVELDPATRRGILTQPLVIAAHSKEAGYSVVQMGRFVRERLLCQTVPPPPPDVDTTLDSTEDNADLTYREKLGSLTEGSPCSACHTLINPPGFAYLAYDPIGRFVAQDSLGRAFQTDGVLTQLDGEDQPFVDAPTMIDALADSRAVRACFTERYIEYAFGRTLAPADFELYHALVDDLEASGGDFAAFVATLVGATEFGSTGPRQ